MKAVKQKLFRRISFIRTSLGLALKGFYTPYNYLRSVDPDAFPYDAIAELFEARRGVFEDFIVEMGGHEARFLASDEGFPKPDWDSNWISPLDAAALHTMIARHKPKRVLEIGSGNSTHHMLRAIVDHGLDTQVTCIDPIPRIEVGDLPVTFKRRVLGREDIEDAAKFEADDILFIDSSHIVQEGFDVDIIFNHLFPRLNSGVIVHVHDVFLPYGYPKSWHEYRFNEQIALIGWLVSGYFEPLFPAHFAYQDMTDQLNAICPNRPLVTDQNGGALWLRKV